MWGYGMNRKRLFILGLLCLAVLALSLPVGLFLLARSHFRTTASAPRPQDPSLVQARIASEYGKMPLSFEENLGQSDPRVKFMARGSDYTVFLADDESTTFQLSAPLKDAKNPSDGGVHSLRTHTPAKHTEAVVRLALAGSNRHAPVEGLELQPGRSNYFIGNDPSRWQRSVPHYSRVKYRGVYPGVDLVYYGHQGQLESDYVLAPGADPSQIGLQVSGARAVKLNSQGSLVLSTPAGDVVLHKPVAYQETGTGRQEIATNFVQRGPRLVGFHVAPYDTQQPLIIDPVMIYSTYFGGSNTDFANAIAVDSAGNAYITGFTKSTTTATPPFPVKTPLTGQGTFLATQVQAHETFISKLSPDGAGLVYSTYLGGVGSGTSDQGSAIAVNANGEAFVAGTTGAPDFPTSGTGVTPIQSIIPNNSGAAYLVRLNSTGSALMYSTFLGGNGHDNGLGLALDPAGIAYVVGATTSTNFPVSASPAAFQATTNVPGARAGTGFLSKIDTTLNGNSGLLYSTYFGGAGGEQIDAIAVDSNGNAFMTGETSSANFPIPASPAPFQATLATSTFSRVNAFIARINTTVGGSGGLLYSSYLGGTGSSGGGDQGNGIALDGNDNAYIVGATNSLDFPVTSGAFQMTNLNVNKLKRAAFVARFDTTQSGIPSLIYSTYLGGTGSIGEQAFGVAVDSLKQAYVSGFASSPDFPETPVPPQVGNNGANAFVTVFNPTGTALIFSTLWGGTAQDIGAGIALDNALPPNIYMAGGTDSTVAFTTSSNAFQRIFGGIEDAFVVKFSPASTAGTVFVAPTTIAFGSQTVNTTSPPQTITLTNGANTALTINSFPTSGANPSDFTVSNTTGTTACPLAPGLTLAAGANCQLSVVFSPTTTAAESATLTIHETNGGGTLLQQTVNLTGSGTASGIPDFTISAQPSSATVSAGSPANFVLTVTSVTGFNAAVTAACSGMPPASTCTLTPTSVTPTANGTSTINGAITTTKFSLMPPPPSFFRVPPGFPGWLWTLAGIAIAFLTVWMASRHATRKLAFGVGLLALLCLTSCSGPVHIGTPAGTYKLIVTATSGALKHPVTFTLTVN
jgi:hypothetical protein